MTEFDCKFTSLALDRINFLILQGLKIVTGNCSSSTILRKLRKLFHLLKLIAFITIMILIILAKLIISHINNWVFTS